MSGSKRHSRPGFTLVEMLVTVTVIGIIVAMALGALMNAQETAREQRTRSLISKLHTQIMFRWESYQTRRIPMAVPQGTLQDRAWHRLHAMRELMRLEMPDRWSDVYDPSNGPEDFAVKRWALSELPALSESYLRFYLSLPTPPTDQHESAECLYLIVTMGHDDALGGQRIHPSDVGDTDGDGAKEFIDGWGRPIGFLRWAPGFLPNSIDPLTKRVMYSGHAPDEIPPGVNLPSGTDATAISVATDLQSGDRENDHDPLDPLRVDAFPAVMPPFPLSVADRQAIANDAWRGFRMTPLIYSAGPDGKSDIKSFVSGFTYSSTQPMPNDPYVKFPDPASPTGPMLGTPMDFDNDGFDHTDNITNHALEVR